MVATVGLHATQGVTLAVIRQSAVGEHVTKGAVLAPYNKPSVAIQANMARIVAVFREPAQVHVTGGRVLAVVKGRVERPNLAAWTFTLDGHDFYVLKTHDETLVHDFSSGAWYTWGSSVGDSWRAQIGQNWNAQLGGVLEGLGGFANGNQISNVLVGDDTTGALYFLDPSMVEDHSPDGGSTVPFTRIITGQIAIRTQDYINCPSIFLTCSNGEVPVGVDLTIELTISDDRGHTYWSAGTQSVVTGVYDFDMEWRSLGSYTGPGRLFRLTDTGAVHRVDGMDIPDDK